MKRQGLTTTINELSNLRRKLFEEAHIDNEDFMITRNISFEKERKELLELREDLRNKLI
jgi:hypothetical protein